MTRYGDSAPSGSLAPGLGMELPQSTIYRSEMNDNHLVALCVKFLVFTIIFKLA